MRAEELPLASEGELNTKIKAEYLPLQLARKRSFLLSLLRVSVRDKKINELDSIHKKRMRWDTDM